jgi:chromosome segregation ATPase
MEIVMANNASDTATGLSGPLTAARSVLDRRRNKLQVAKANAASAVSDLRRLDEQLASNDDQRREQEAALQAALARVVLLRKAIKASIKEAGKLRAAREDAGKRAAEAQQRVTAAEASRPSPLIIGI